MTTLINTTQFETFKNDFDSELVVSSPISVVAYRWEENDFNGYNKITAYNGLNHAWGVSLEDVANTKLEDYQEVSINYN